MRILNIMIIYARLSPEMKPEALPGECVYFSWQVLYMPDLFLCMKITLMKPPHTLTFPRETICWQFSGLMTSFWSQRKFKVYFFKLSWKNETAHKDMRSTLERRGRMCSELYRIHKTLGMIPQNCFKRQSLHRGLKHGPCLLYDPLCRKGTASQLLFESATQ